MAARECGRAESMSRSRSGGSARGGTTLSVSARSSGGPSRLRGSEETSGGRREPPTDSDESTNESSPLTPWVEDEWPERVQRTLKELWGVIKTFRELEIESTRKMRAAVAEVREKEEEMARTKAVAKSICQFYGRQAMEATADKIKAWVVVFCVLGGFSVCFMLCVLVQGKGRE